MAIGKLPDADDGSGDGDSIFAEINITPLTDVFLVLVIIFMVGALAVQVERQEDKKKSIAQTEIEKKSGIKINLPSGQAQEIDPTKASLVLEIPLSGDVNREGGHRRSPRQPVPAGLSARQDDPGRAQGRQGRLARSRGEPDGARQEGRPRPPRHRHQRRLTADFVQPSEQDATARHAGVGRRHR